MFGINYFLGKIKVFLRRKGMFEVKEFGEKKRKKKVFGKEKKVLALK